MGKNILVVAFLLFTLYPAWAIDAYVYNGTGQTAENKLVALTLAGIVNRGAPRLYLRNVYETWSYASTDESWENLYKTDGKVNFTVITDINQLVEIFRSNIKGVISYNPTLTYGNFTGQSFRWQGEAAALLGGFTDCIPVATGTVINGIQATEKVELSDFFGSMTPVMVSARLEDPAHAWNNSSLSQEQRYFAWLDWALENLLPRSNPAQFYLREITDWAVHQRMFQLNLAGTEDLRFTSLSDAKAARIEQVMNYLRSKRPGKIFHVYGWMRPEPLVQWVSAYGGSFHETLLSNLSWHHVFPVDSTFWYSRPSTANKSEWKLENKYYLLFQSSEGDAGNWVAGFQGGAWHSSTQGEVPIGWGVNLHLFDQFPFIAQYYYRTAGATDGFIAVSAALGYTFPDLFPPAYLNDAIAQSTRLMQKFDIHSVYAYKHYNGAGKSTYRGIEIANNFNFQNLGNFALQTEAQLTLLFDPALQTQRAYTGYGGLLYNHVNDETFYANVSNLTTVRDRILTKLNGKQKPGFLLAGYQRFRHDEVVTTTAHDMTLPRLKTLMNNLSSDPVMGQDIEFVTPEKFTWLLRKSMSLPTHLSELSSSDTEVEITATGRGKLTIVIQNAEPQQVSVSIYTITGKKEYETTWQVLTDRETTTAQLSQSGMYIVQLRGTNFQITRKIGSY